jgi:hypothetical protein
VAVPTQTTIEFVVDKALGLSATATNCSFIGVPATVTMSSSKVVSLGYVVFTRSVTPSLLEAAVTAEQKKVASEAKATNFKVSYSKYKGLGVTAVFYEWSASMPMPTGVMKLAYEGIATLQGAKSYEAAINNNTLSKAKVGSLARLAMKL